MYFGYNKEELHADHVYNWRKRLPIVFSPSLHPSMSAKSRLVFVESAIWKVFALKRPNGFDDFIPRWDC
jgi:hypothetical protein